jgi:aldehyde dehydrogenase (NAD+)
METGSVWINEGLALSPFAAFGGRKQSGIGVENGVEGLMAYTEPQTFLIAQ